MGTCVVQRKEQLGSVDIKLSLHKAVLVLELKLKKFKGCTKNRLFLVSFLVHQHSRGSYIV